LPAKTVVTKVFAMELERDFKKYSKVVNANFENCFAVVVESPQSLLVREPGLKTETMACTFFHALLGHLGAHLFCFELST